MMSYGIVWIPPFQVWQPSSATVIPIPRRLSDQSNCLLSRNKITPFYLTDNIPSGPMMGVSQQANCELVIYAKWFIYEIFVPELG